MCLLLLSIKVKIKIIVGGRTAETVSKSERRKLGPVQTAQEINDSGSVQGWIPEIGKSDRFQYAITVNS